MTPPLHYDDDRDHLVNGVLRLLGLEEVEFERWRALAGEAEGDVPERLAAGWRALRPPPAPPDGVAVAAPVAAGPDGESGELWHAAIAETPSVGFARDGAGRVSWLVRWDGERWARELEPPEYEEAYFEGERSAGGYAGYREQAGWRLEKASRQVRELREATGLERGRVLDVGSGYGYFRVALEEAGFEHEGLEVSGHARLVAREAFGQQTHGGLLEDHDGEWPERFDAVTGFDLIEHVADPEDFLRTVRGILRPGGVVGLKTPNIDAPEADVFGPHYHSLKREHLVLFSPESLTATAQAAGFETLAVSTVSHLLQGFVGRERCAEWAREGRGADVVAWYRRVD